jgi:hypothetical protein
MKIKLQYDRGHNGPLFNINKYYTLPFYFPYLSLLVQSVNILVYRPGPINMFSPGFCPNSFFVLDIQPEALKSLYRSLGYKKKQLVLCKNYVLQW